MDQLRNYLRSERAICARSHKRYITIPSGKRQRTEDMNVHYTVEEESPSHNEQYSQPVKEETGETVISSNVVLVAPNQTPEQTVIMPVNMNPVNDMSLL